MEKIKIQSNDLGVCPYCNSLEIQYEAVRFEDDYLYFPCHCEKCGRYFEQWNELKFIGNNVGSSGEYEAQVGLEIDYEEEQKNEKINIK